MRPLISIIIPVYNAANTIDRCISSINCNTPDYEIVCIDDGSTDESGKILDALSLSNQRIKVIHQANAGAGAARNMGINVASGEYLMFLDSDDTYDTDTMDCIVSDIKKYDPDYIVFHRKTLRTDGTVQIWGSGDNVSVLDCDWATYLNKYIIERRHGMGVVTKVFRKCIIDRFSILFNDRFTFGEDTWFLLMYLPHASKLIEDYRVFYIQHQTPGSICMTSYDNFVELNLACIEEYQRLYPTSGALLSGFILDYKVSIIQRAVTKTYEDFSVFEFQKRKNRINRVLDYSDNRKALETYILKENVSERSKLHIRYLLQGMYFRHWLKAYAYPSFKNTVKVCLNTVKNGK